MFTPIEQFRALEKSTHGEIPFKKIAKDLQMGYMVSWTNKDIPAARRIHKVVTRFGDTYFHVHIYNTSLLALLEPSATLSITVSDREGSSSEGGFWFMLFENSSQSHFSDGKITDEREFWRQYRASEADFDATQEAFRKDLARNDSRVTISPNVIAK